MKILHTSDWHLGKKLEGRSRIAEQTEVLGEIIAIAEAEKVDLVLIAGDIYDTATPSAEAEELFYDKIAELSSNKRAIFIVSGNHDDADRLCAPSPFAKKMGIALVGNGNDVIAVNGKTAVYPEKTGKGYAIYTDGMGQRVFIKALPYPTEARYKEDASNKTFDEKMSDWINSGLENSEQMTKILVGHFFVAGGKVSESERNIDLGGIRAVKPDLIPNFDYVALGHLHKRQKMSSSKNIYYSGSILQYSFDEAGTEKSVTVFDADNDGVKNVKEIPLKSGVRLARLAANSVEEAYVLLEKYQDHYVELTLNLNAPLDASDAKAFKKNYKNLLVFNLQIAGSTDRIKQSKKHLNDVEMFKSYYKEKFNQDAPSDLLELFMEMLGGVE